MKTHTANQTVCFFAVGILLGIICGIGLAVPSFKTQGKNTERKKWCVRYHESYYKVEQCLIEPDWSLSNND